MKSSKKELAKLSTTEVCFLQNLQDSEESRFFTIQEDVYQQVADNINMFLGSGIMPEYDIKITPMTFQVYKNSLERHSLTVQGELSLMNTNIILNLPEKTCENLLTFAMGARHGEPFPKYIFAPAGLAILQKISEVILHGIGDGWKSFSEKETGIYKNSWTNPALCRVFIPETPVLVIEMEFSVKYSMTLVYSLYELYKFSTTLSLKDNSTLIFEKKSEGQILEIPKCKKNFWHSVFNFFSPEDSRQPKYEVFKCLCTSGIGACLSVLENEHPQVAAAALSCIPETRAREILDSMEMYMKHDIMGRMKKLDIRQASLLMIMNDVFVRRIEKLQAIDTSVSWN